MDKTERYLKSIDSTLGEILKELKRQGRSQEPISFTLDGKKLEELVTKENTTIKDIQGYMK